MLSFFSILYQDELLYSGIARYHIRSGNKNFSQTDLDLFGYSSQQICRITLTNNIKHLAKEISHLSNNSIGGMLRHHTLYPFYATFLTRMEVKKLESAMIEKRSGSILGTGLLKKEG